MWIRVREHQAAQKQQHDSKARSREISVSSSVTVKDFRNPSVWKPACWSSFLPREVGFWSSMHGESDPGTPGSSSGLFWDSSKRMRDSKADLAFVTFHAYTQSC